MAEQVKICYKNILETSNVTVTTENTSFPKYRLYDRDIGKLFKGTAFASPFVILLDQVAVISYEVDRLIIPARHNLNGLVCSLRYSTDNFSADDHEAVGWTQGDALLINKTFTAQTKQYWKLNVTAPATIVEMSEMFLGKLYTFQANPLIGSREGWKRNLSSEETESGLDRDVKRGESRRYRNYELSGIESAQKADFEAWEAECQGVKPFWVIDHYGVTIFMKMLNDLEFAYLLDDPTYGCILQLREVLGQTT